jgi:hypothetical protein
VGPPGGDVFLQTLFTILNALESMASANGREWLQAFEYRFGPRANEYLMVERCRSSGGDENEAGKPIECEEHGHRELMEVAHMVLDEPNIYDFKDILDRISQIARSEPQNEAQNS